MFLRTQYYTYGARNWAHYFIATLSDKFLLLELIGCPCPLCDGRLRTDAEEAAQRETKERIRTGFIQDNKWERIMTVKSALRSRGLLLRTSNVLKRHSLRRRVQVGWLYVTFSEESHLTFRHAPIISASALSRLTHSLQHLEWFCIENHIIIDRDKVMVSHIGPAATMSVYT